MIIKIGGDLRIENNIMPKEVAEKYLLKQPPIGEGRFGKVYWAKEYKTSKKVAIKMVGEPIILHLTIVSDWIPEIVQSRSSNTVNY